MELPILLFTAAHQRSGFDVGLGLLASRAKPGGFSTILDHTEIAADPFRAYIEWIRFARLAAGGGVGFEIGIIEFGVIRQKGCCTIGCCGPPHRSIRRWR
jgi:hypothetical protein